MSSQTTFSCIDLHKTWQANDTTWIYLSIKFCLIPKSYKNMHNFVPCIQFLGQQHVTMCLDYVRHRLVCSYTYSSITNGEKLQKEQVGCVIHIMKKRKKLACSIFAVTTYILNLSIRVCKWVNKTAPSLIKMVCMDYHDGYLATLPLAYCVCTVVRKSWYIHKVAISSVLDGLPAIHQSSVVTWCKHKAC